MFLDQVVLKQQRILLIIHHNMMDMANLADQDSCLTRLFLIKKIRGDTSFKVLGLAHIYDFASLVKILIDARLIRQNSYQRLKVLKPLGIG